LRISIPARLVVVVDRCTCGAVPPEDARFCHKCGRPLYEADIARIAAQDAPPQPVIQAAVPSAKPVGVSFKNFRALAITTFMAGTAFVISGVAAVVSPLLFPLVLLAAGFFAAVIYKNQAAGPISTAAGALLGWMTGLWLFIVFALAAISPAGAQAIKQMQSVPEFSQLMSKDPHQLVLIFAVSGFCFVTLIPGLGGLLGALLSMKGRHSS
jgi:hypothetical protein